MKTMGFIYVAGMILFPRDTHALGAGNILLLFTITYIVAVTFYLYRNSKRIREGQITYPLSVFLPVFGCLYIALTALLWWVIIPVVLPMIQ